MSLTSPSPDLAPGLQTLLDAGFIEHDGCVFLASAADSVPDGDLLDQTGREALVNHVHIEDELAHDDKSFVVAQALRYTRGLAEHLASALPGDGFDVVLAVGDSPVVRFYCRRVNEPPWLTTDLEAYEQEAVLLLTVG
jgi:hypothetical protein